MTDILATVRKLEIVLTLDPTRGHVKIESRTDYPIEYLESEEAAKCPVLQVGYEAMTTALLYELARRKNIEMPNTDAGYDEACATVTQGQTEEDTDAD